MSEEPVNTEPLNTEPLNTEPLDKDAEYTTTAAPRRLHPLTPFAKGWTAMVAVVAIFGQHAARGDNLQWGAYAAGAAFAVFALLAWLSWGFTTYRIEGDDLRSDSGVLFRRTRHIHLDKLQAVDIVRPLVARLLGLAELQLQVAGGGNDAEAKLSFLKESEAQALRAELLARAAGVKPDAGEAPERILVVVPMQALFGAMLLSVPTWFFLLPVTGLMVFALVWGNAAFLLGFVPLFFGAWQFTVGRILTNFDFTVAESPDGLRLHHGLLEQRHQTVPPGRVQAVRIVEPWLWRLKGWVKVELNIAGYGPMNGDQSKESILLPVAPREVAMGLLGRILPGVDVDAVPLVKAPRRARWRRPVTWRGLACGHDGEVFVAKRGVFRKETDVILHAKVQSVRRTQGPWSRRLGLATVHLDSTPGPVHVHAALRDADEAFEIAYEQAERSRVGRKGEGPSRWAAPQSTAPDSGEVPD